MRRALRAKTHAGVHCDDVIFARLQARGGAVECACILWCVFPWGFWFVTGL